MTAMTQPDNPRPLPPVRPGYYRGESYRIEESVGFLMKQVVEMLSRAMDERMEEYSLTDAQWRPLLMLQRHTSETATGLARNVGCDAGAVTRMIDRLEDKGLVRRVRNADDRRIQNIELTDDGKNAVAVVPYVISDVLNAHLADLSDAEVEQLKGLLKRILARGRQSHDGR